jgi:hypothetical protein
VSTSRLWMLQVVEDDRHGYSRGVFEQEVLHCAVWKLASICAQMQPEEVEAAVTSTPAFHRLTSARASSTWLAMPAPALVDFPRCCANTKLLSTVKAGISTTFMGEFALAIYQLKVLHQCLSANGCACKSSLVPSVVAVHALLKALDQAVAGCSCSHLEQACSCCSVGWPVV